MAERFAFSLASTIIEKISTPIIEELSLAWGVKDDLQRLKNTMSSVYAVLLDAQQKQETNHQLKDWLGKLNESLYDAEIVLDAFEIDGLRRKVFGQSISGKVRNFFSPKNQVVFRFKIAHKIKKIRKELDEVSADRNKFNLIERCEDRVVFCREMTHSFVRPEDVIGRDDDIADIIMYLLQENGHENVSVLPIVGLGGMGKTTLSKMVFNDKRVIENFDLRLWNCISDDFDLLLIVRKILKSLGIANCNKLELEQLQNLLRDKLDGKKYFLVLDDVWNENRAKWIELKNLLMGGAKGSKIIVSTRSKSVASIMSTNDYIKEIKGLSHEEGLSLFLKWSFRSVQDSEKHPNLVEVAQEIVKKCKGVPLAIKTLANILYLKTEIRDWEHVRDNDVWKMEQKENDILPALKLSYHHLPTYLRRCFSFCSLFPKDHLFRSDKLIMYWGANGLLRNLRYGEDVEDLGIKYIEQLRSIGFFQEFQVRGVFLKFKMHDIVHDLALLVAGPDIISMDSQENRDNLITRKVRHLSIPKSDAINNENMRWLLQQNDIRTIYIPNSIMFTMSAFVQTGITKFKHLFYLDISGFNVLPNSISSLKHLKYLNLVYNNFITSLPDSICDLVGLEVLYFNTCKEIKKLPKRLGKLTRLRHLGLSTKEKLLPEKEFLKLTSLRTLIIDFCPNIKLLFSDNAMLRLSSLRTLIIGECNSLEFLPTKGLRQLSRLEMLSLNKCKKLQLNNSDDDFNCGIDSLRFIELHGLPELVHIPSWLILAAKNLKTLEISWCPNLTKNTLERMLGNSKDLQRLELHYCPGLLSLPNEIQSLTALNEIAISHNKELVKRCQREIGEDWEKISHVPYIRFDEDEKPFFYFSFLYRYFKS